MSIRQHSVFGISCSLVLYLGLPSAAQPLKVYIATDMEGCSGVAGSEQVAAEEGKQLMAGDVRGSGRACWQMRGSSATG